MSTTVEAPDNSSVLCLVAIAIASFKAEINWIRHLDGVSDQDLLAEVVVALFTFTIVQTFVHVGVVRRLVVVLL